ncbi:MAG: Ubiquinone/menaquinone biosynthesis C-methyltransferase UbiE [Betaproteobacteria bacterium ADurb.Bin341]|nr:MAG: Ubiquinone/menaquinone biosynthesis C-methyltransferase UbiE [Betaproteobacteria bacterium ADurb.Bin341]
MDYLEPIDFTADGFGEVCDELSLWAAPFGLMLLEHVPLERGKCILDVGCGTGFLALELAERCGPETRVIAVDPWKSAMHRLRRKIQERGLCNIQLFEEDVCKISVPEASVDLIVSNLGLNNFDHPDAVLNACFRMAKPGASVLMTTNLSGHMAEFYSVYREVLIELGQHDRLPLLESHIQHRGTVDSIRRQLEDARFNVNKVVTDAFRMRFADGSCLLRHYFIRLGFVQAWKSIASPDRIDETFTVLEQKLNALARAQGELALNIPMACFVATK